MMMMYHTPNRLIKIWMQWMMWKLAHVLGVPEEFIAKMSPSKSLPATPVQTMAPPEKVPEIAVENPDPTSMDRQRRIEILKYLMLI